MNPWIGCQRVAPGCQACYAEAFANRFGKAKWGPQGTRVKTSKANWRKPLKWNRDAEKAGVRRRVFCASLADIFEDWPGRIVNSRGEVQWWRSDKGVVGAGGTTINHSRGERPATMDDVRADLFKLVDATPNLDWQLLTKRPENIRRMWPHFVACRKCGVDSAHRLMKYCGDGSDKDNEHHWERAPRPNCWLGTSISDQPTADRNVPLLLECRDLAPVLFLSAEPLLSEIDLAGLLRCEECRMDHPGLVNERMERRSRETHPLCGQGYACPMVGWTIVGCESGPKRRPMELDWAKRLVDQCREAGVAVFVKQLPINGRVSHDMEEWPESLRVREFPAMEVSR